jgi:hypothetical protein
VSRASFSYEFLDSAKSQMNVTKDASTSKNYRVAIDLDTRFDEKKHLQQDGATNPNFSPNSRKKQQLIAIRYDRATGTPLTRSICGPADLYAAGLTQVKLRAQTCQDTRIGGGGTFMQKQGTRQRTGILRFGGSN